MQKGPTFCSPASTKNSIMWPQPRTRLWGRVGKVSHQNPAKAWWQEEGVILLKEGRCSISSRSHFLLFKCRVSQKVYSDFSVTSCRNTQTFWLTEYFNYPLQITKGAYYSIFEWLWFFRTLIWSKNLCMCTICPLMLYWKIYFLFCRIAFLFLKPVIMSPQGHLFSVVG